MKSSLLCSPCVQGSHPSFRLAKPTGSVSADHRGRTSVVYWTDLERYPFFKAVREERKVPRLDAGALRVLGCGVLAERKKFRGQAFKVLHDVGPAIV